MNLKVSAIIPTKNEEKNIARCLTSLKNQVYKNLEIIVVDNESQDNTVKLAEKYTKKVYQQGSERSEQRNFGARESSGKILFFVDADMEVGENVIREVIELLKKDGEVKAVIVPEVSTGENFWAKVRALERNCYLGESAIEAARIFDKKAFFKCGGYDVNLVAAEDWDLTLRIKKIGKIGRIKAKITHHENRLSLISHLKKKYYYAQNIKLYTEKHPERFRAQSGVTRVRIFVKNSKKLVTKPFHGIGVLILKSLEYLVFLLSELT